MTFDPKFPPVRLSADGLKSSGDGDILCDTEEAIKTYKQITREQGGGDWDQNVEQLKIANEKLRDAGASAADAQGNTYDEEEDDE